MAMHALSYRPRHVRETRIHDEAPTMMPTVGSGHARGTALDRCCHEVRPRNSWDMRGRFEATTRGAMPHVYTW